MTRFDYLYGKEQNEPKVRKTPKKKKESPWEVIEESGFIKVIVKSRKDILDPLTLYHEYCLDVPILDYQYQLFYTKQKNVETIAVYLDNEMRKEIYGKRFGENFQGSILANSEEQLERIFHKIANSDKTMEITNRILVAIQKELPDADQAWDYSRNCEKLRRTLKSKER